MGGNNRNIGLINEKGQYLKSYFIFSSIHHKIKLKSWSFYQRLCIVTATCIPICMDLGTGHKLVCWVFGACLMAISKGRFFWHCKMASKVLRKT